MNEQKWISRITLAAVILLIIISSRKPQVQIINVKSESEIKNEILNDIDSVIRNVDTIKSIDSALVFIRSRYGLPRHSDSSFNGQ